MTPGQDVLAANKPLGRRRFRVGTWTADPQINEIRAGERLVKVEPKVMALLVFLAERAGQTVSRDELLDGLWGGVAVVEEALTRCVSQLRRALADDPQDPQYIQTISKRGYRLLAPVVVEEPSVPEHGRHLTADITRIASTADSPKAASAPGPSSRHVTFGIRARKRMLAVVAVVAGLAAVSYGILLRRSLSEPMLTLSAVAIPLTAYPGFEDAPSLSPDGSQVAFSWTGPAQDNADIYVKLVGPGEPVRLTRDPARDDNPAWSRDGRFIAFQRYVTESSADVFVVPALGGAERKLARISLRRRGRWLASRAGNLSWTPDGQWIAFGGSPSPEEAAGIWLIGLHRPERRRLTESSSPILGDWEPGFSHDGRLLAFVRERALSASALYVVPVSPDLRLAGTPTRVTPDHALARGPAWLPGDRGLVFSWGARLGVSRLYKIELAPTPSGPVRQPDLLPFGEHASAVSVSQTGRIVYSASFRDTAMWNFALDGRQDGASPTLMVPSTFDEQTPDYSPDGKRLAFASTRSSTEEIWISNIDGSNSVQVTSMGGPGCSNPRWSPDGRTIVFNSRSEGSADLYTLRPDTGELRRISNDPAEEIEPRWSQDGRTIYFASNRTGRFEVWKMSAEGGSPLRITQQGGVTASESPDGRFLYYSKDVSSPTSIWRVPVGGGEEAQVVDGLSYSLNFVVATRALYFVAVGDAPHKTSLDFYDYATGKRTTLLNVGKQWWYGAALSPDQRSLLYTTVDRAGSNLMLVDNLRR